jgi:hypothetical protein
MKFKNWNQRLLARLKEQIGDAFSPTGWKPATKAVNALGSRAKI